MKHKQMADQHERLIEHVLANTKEVIDILAQEPGRVISKRDAHHLLLLTDHHLTHLHDRAIAIAVRRVLDDPGRNTLDPESVTRLRTILDVYDETWPGHDMGRELEISVSQSWTKLKRLTKHPQMTIAAVEPLLRSEMNLTARLLQERSKRLLKHTPCMASDIARAMQEVIKRKQQRGHRGL